MEGETGKEAEMGMEGEAGIRRFPLAEALAFSLLGSIRPSHILHTVSKETKAADLVLNDLILKLDIRLTINDNDFLV